MHVVTISMNCASTRGSIYIQLQGRVVQLTIIHVYYILVLKQFSKSYCYYVNHTLVVYGEGVPLRGLDSL